jgi:acetyltransferase EpsM
MIERKLVFIGCGGNAAVAYSTTIDFNAAAPYPERWVVIGFLDDDPEIGDFLGLPVLGPISSAIVGNLLSDPSIHFVWTLNSVSNRESFLDRFTKLNIPPERLASVTHPTAVISNLATIGRGVMIHPNVVIGPEVAIGDNVSLYAGVMVGHNSALNDHTYVANNGCVGGHVTMEVGAYAGTNCSIREFVTLGAWSVLGIGSVLLTSIPPYATYVGSPAKPLRKI